MLRSQFCAAEHIDGLIYGHPMFAGQTPAAPQIAEPDLYEGEDADIDFDFIDGAHGVDYGADAEADFGEEVEASPSYSTKVFLECGE